MEGRAGTPPLGDPLLFRLQRVMTSAVALSHLLKYRGNVRDLMAPAAEGPRGMVGSAQHVPA